MKLTKNSIKSDETNGLPYLPIDIIPMNSLGISELKSDEEANSSLITFDKNDILIVREAEDSNAFINRFTFLL